MRYLFVLVLLSACATSDPFDDIARVQQRLDARGIGFGVTRVPGHDAFVLQLRFSASGVDAEPITDPMAAAQAAAPEGCTVVSVTPTGEDGAYRVDYQCV